MDRFKESCALAGEILRDNTDGFMFVAVKGGEAAVATAGSVKKVAQAFANAYDSRPELRALLTAALAIHARRRGNIINIRIPQDPSDN